METQVFRDFQNDEFGVSASRRSKVRPNLREFAPRHWRTPPVEGIFFADIFCFNSAPLKG